jgi:hypothetical protein
MPRTSLTTRFVASAVKRNARKDGSARARLMHHTRKASQ